MAMSHDRTTQGVASPRNKDLKEPRSCYFPGRAMVLRIFGLEDQRLGAGRDGPEGIVLEQKTTGTYGKSRDCHDIISSNNHVRFQCKRV